MTTEIEEQDPIRVSLTMTNSSKDEPFYYIDYKRGIELSRGLLNPGQRRSAGNYQFDLPLKIEFRREGFDGPIACETTFTIDDLMPDCRAHTRDTKYDGTTCEQGRVTCVRIKDK